MLRSIVAWSCFVTGIRCPSSILVFFSTSSWSPSDSASHYKNASRVSVCLYVFPHEINYQSQGTKRQCPWVHSSINTVGEIICNPALPVTLTKHTLLYNHLVIGRITRISEYRSTGITRASLSSCCMRKIMLRGSETVCFSVAAVAPFSFSLFIPQFWSVHFMRNSTMELPFLSALAPTPEWSYKIFLQGDCKVHR